MVSMRSEIDEVALQGIEFWSNVCDQEVDLAIEFLEVSYRSRTLLSLHAAICDRLHNCSVNIYEDIYVCGKLTKFIVTH